MRHWFGFPICSSARSVVAGLVAWSLALPTYAAPAVATRTATEAEILLEQAATAYDRDDFDAAIAAFEAAYALEGDPACLFNIGRVHEEAGELQLALDRYKEFVLQPRVALEDRAMANDRIEVLRALLRTVQESPSVPRAVPDDRAAESDGNPRPVRSAPAQPSRGLIIAGGVSAGVAVGAVAVGALFQGLSRSTAQDVSSAPNPQQRDALIATARREAATGDVLLISGAVLVTVGIPLLAVGLVRRGRDRRRSLGGAPGGMVLRF